MTRRIVRLLAVLALAGVGGVAVGLGVHTLNGPVLERLAQVPAQAGVIRSLAELTDTLARAATAAAYLERVQREDRRLNLSLTLRQQAQTVGVLVGEVSVAGLDPDQTSSLRRMAVRLAGDADELNHIAGARLTAEAALRQLQERLMERHAAFRGTLAGLTHEGVHMLQLPDGEAAGTGLLNSRDELEALDQSLMTSLVAAATLPLPPALLDEREAVFQRDARTLMERINALPIGSATTRRSEAARFLLALGLDTGNVFEQQRELQRLRTAGQAQGQSIRDRIDEASKSILDLIRRHNDGLVRQTRQAARHLGVLPPLAGVGAALALLLVLGRTTRPAAPAAPPPPAPETAANRPLRILLAEDEPINQMVCAAMLRRGGHSVTVTTDGVEAVDAIRHAPLSTRFDLAILDLRMPNLDGLGALRAIRALDDPTLARLPIAILTASIIPEDADSCRAAGADMVLPKPLRPESLQPLFARLLGRPLPAPQTEAEVPPAPAAAGDDGGFNDLAIRQMCDALPAGRVATLINGTLTALSDYGDNLREAWGTGDLPRVSAMAHKIAGVAGVYGCLSLRAAAQTLEMAVEKRDADPAPLLAALETALPAALDRLGAERDRLAADVS